MFAPFVPFITVGIGLLVLQNAWLAILGYHAAMISVLLLSKTQFNFGGILRGNKNRIPIAAALLGACAGILLFVLWPHLSVPADFQDYIRSIGLYGWTWPVFIAYYSLVNPLLEEYYWRGYLAAPSKNITLNDGMFAGYHLLVLAGHIVVVWLFVGFIMLTTGAWFWRQMNRQDDGLRASVFSHMAADITVILTIWYFAGK
jgi:membrane protease YdiL (CAAX protease family)